MPARVKGWLWPIALSLCWASVARADDENLEYMRLTQEAMTADAHHQHVDAAQKGEAAVKAAKREKGADHERVADMHYNLGQYYAHQGKWAEALAQYDRSMPIYAKHRGDGHEYIAQVLSKMIEAQANQHQFDAAQASAERALRIMEALGSPPAKIYTYVWQLGHTHLLAGNAERGAELLARCASVGEEIWGRDGAQLIPALTMAGKAYHEANDFVAAMAYHRRSLTLIEKHLGRRSKEAAVVLGNIAGAYQELGQLNLAIAYYDESLSLRRALYGEEHLETATLQVNYAELLRMTRRAAEAEIAVRAAAKVFEAERDQLHHAAHAYKVMSRVLLERGLPAEAEAWAVKALAATETFWGAGHAEVAHVLLDIVDAQRAGKRYDEARASVERALRIYRERLGADHANVANALESQALLLSGEASVKVHEQALAIRRARLGEHHAMVALSHSNLAMVQASLHHWDEALAHQRACNEIRERELTNTLEMASEMQRSIALEDYFAETDATLSLHLYGAPDNEEAAAEALLTVLRRKGRILDGMAGGLAALRSRASKEDRKLLDELAEARRQLAGLLLMQMTNAALDDRDPQVAQLKKRTQEIEQQLGRRMGGIMAAETASLEALDAALEEDVAYVEYALFQPVKFDRPECTDWHLAVYVKRKGQPPVGQVLMTALTLEQDIQALRATLAAPDSDPKEAAARMYRALLAPIEPMLGDAKRILVSPDGALNLIPFGALVDAKGRYAVSRWSFRYLSSGRDLLKPKSAAVPRQGTVLVGAPAFGDRAAGRERGGLRFEPLPAAAAETDALQKLLLGATALTGAAATERAVKALHGPPVLHIATHGFFLSEEASGAGKLCTRGVQMARVDTPKEETNPLLLSGLAFAGANGADGAKEDGVLTALEASSLDLLGTELVVLSACETGVGEVRNGDGVHGLRRAFELAGAETQVMSLWKVDDAATQSLMVAYYDALRSGRGRVDAMRDVQLAMLDDPHTSHPFFWAGFIVSGRDGAIDAGRPIFAPPTVEPSARGCSCSLTPSATDGWWSAALAFAWVLRRSRARRH